MNPSAQAEQKLASAHLDYRLALTFTPVGRRAALTALFAVYLEIREVLVECHDPGVAEVKLAWWQQEIEALYAGKSRHPLAQALASHLAPLAAKKELFLDLITGTRMDIAGSTPASFEDVKRYCYRHSGALAELSARLMGAATDQTALAARLLGNSYRLAYIVTAGAQEALRGRVYFAAEDLKIHGVDRHVHGEGDDAPLQALLKDYAQRMEAMRADGVAEATSTERVCLAPWRVLSRLGRKRVAKFAAAGFRLSDEAVELQPLSALFTAWRGARENG